MAANSLRCPNARQVSGECGAEDKRGLATTLGENFVKQRANAASVKKVSLRWFVLSRRLVVEPAFKVV